MSFYSRRIYLSLSQVDEIGTWPKLPKPPHCHSSLLITCRFSVSLAWIVSIGRSQRGMVSVLVQCYLVFKCSGFTGNRNDSATVDNSQHIAVFLSWVSASLTLLRLICVPPLLSWGCRFWESVCLCLVFSLWLDCFLLVLSLQKLICHT